MESLGRGTLATAAGVGALILTAVIFGAGCNGHIFEVMQVGSIGTWVASICILLSLIGLGAATYGMRNLHDAWNERQNALSSHSVPLGWGGH